MTQRKYRRTEIAPRKIAPKQPRNEEQFSQFQTLELSSDNQMMRFLEAS